LEGRGNHVPAGKVWAASRCGNRTLFSQLLLIRQPGYTEHKPVSFLLLLNFSTYQPLNFFLQGLPAIARGCPHSGVWFSHYLFKGVTQEGVAENFAKQKSERGGSLPHILIYPSAQSPIFISLSLFPLSTNLTVTAFSGRTSGNMSAHSTSTTPSERAYS